MIAAGALLVGMAVAAGLLAARPPSSIAERLARLAPRPRVPGRVASWIVTNDLGRSGAGWSASDLLRAKLVCALALAVAVGGIGLLLDIAVPVAALLVAAYVGFVLPTLHVERLARRRRDDATTALLTAIEWTEALVASGRPAETALVTVAGHGVGAPLIDGALAAAVRSYTLGAPLYPALAREADAAGLPPLADLAHELERSRGLGQGTLAVLREERDRLRDRERARSLDAAGRVEGRLMLVLVLCYLPALMLLVVIPMFLGLLRGLSV